MSAFANCGRAVAHVRAAVGQLLIFQAAKADMLTTKVALLGISNCRSGFLGAGDEGKDALAEDLADKAHKQTICKHSRCLMQDRAVANHTYTLAISS